jgi:sec-independent protein translocase protein TatB
MFDIGFSELVVIALVALIVIGPERLPRVARTAGALLGRAQRYINDVKADIQREVDMSELSSIKDTFQEAAKSVQQSVAEVGQELQAAGESLNQSIAAAGETKAEPTAQGPLAAIEEPAVPAQMELGLEPKPTAEHVTESIAKHAAEPVAKPEAEPLAEHAAEPVAEHAAKPAPAHHKA